jgi:CheY-like chemotaxis protein
MPDPIRIVVADDEPLVYRFVDQALKDAGFDVTAARNGEEALAFIRTGQYSLLISDVMMPEMDGFELLRAMRDNPATNHLPILLMTAIPSRFPSPSGFEIYTGATSEEPSIIYKADRLLGNPAWQAVIVDWVRSQMDAG